MKQAAARKRLEKLEAQAREVELERALNDPESRSLIETYAKKVGVTPEQFIRETKVLARHIADVGEDAYRAELLAADRERAERYGISLERYRDIDWVAEHDQWVAEGSIPGAWRGRDWSR